MENLKDSDTQPKPIMTTPRKQSANLLNQCMPFFGNEFFECVAGYSAEVSMSLLRAGWHFWAARHCDGLPDDDDYLRRVCRVAPGDWPAIKRIIFDNDKHFRMIDGLWHLPLKTSNP